MGPKRLTGSFAAVKKPCVEIYSYLNDGALFTAVRGMQFFELGYVKCVPIYQIESFEEDF